ncbi:Nucleoporin Nup120/160 [Ferrimonas sediminum]|uniref:Nucleoporin Nup120/160 n=1 Tax=Ferrimonas sediminum TaxID=718193 RepID=A0A1G8S1R9_9GAMM|nr:hypothetical protein [Ferrimonas sediminum]SDJ23178.1 Nucleoporin Nup120/160 [Ferrimonas sediminum]
MMSKQIRFETLTEQQLASPTLQSTPLDGRIRIEWGRDDSYTMVCDDEDSRKSFNRHSDTVIGVLPLKGSKQVFLTIGLDHVIQLSAFSGRSLHSMSDHSDRIFGVIEIAKDRLLSASLDGTVRIWNLRSGSLVCTIDAKITSLSAIQMFANSEHLAISDGKGVSIWSFTGKKIAVMQGLKSRIIGVSTLQNGSWMVQSEKQHPSIWSATGKFLHRFKFDFDFADDMHEVDSERLLIRQPGKSLGLWHVEGELISEHLPDDDIVAAFDNLKQGHQTRERYIEQRPEVIDFPHVRNPLGNSDSVFTARAELEQQKLDLDAKAERRMFWDFFNRPLFTPIRTALKQPIKEAREQLEILAGVREASEQQQQLRQSKRKGASIWSWVFLVLAVVAAGVGYLFFLDNALVMDLIRQQQPELVDRLGRNANLALAVGAAGIGGACLLLSLVMLIRNRIHRGHQLKQEANLEVVDCLAPQFDGLIGAIKDYRQGLLNNIPVVKDMSALSPNKVMETMDRHINDTIEAMAMEECGLEREDIVYTNHESIVLSDWALIQDLDKRAQVKSKLNYGNERSFWSSGSDGILFAVQYIQYIFLTEDKVDVFTTYYDFISGKCIGKEANAFYYKDVTNIAKRNVERGGQSTVNEKEISVTEIALYVASGERIRLTILNEDSVSAIAASAKDNENITMVDRIEKLEQERQNILDDQTISETERQEELDMNAAEMADLKTQNVAQNVQKTASKADETVKNIRIQLRDHKQSGKHDEAHIDAPIS